MDEDRASVAGSNPSLISNRPILEAKPPSRRSSRSTSPIRSTVALLRSAAPPIDICQPGPAAAASPGEAVNKLKGFLLDGYDKAFIPRQLEARLRKIAPDEAIVLHEAMFHDHHGYTTEELDSLWEDIQDVCYEANACSNLLKDENAWVQVVRSVLRLGGMHALSKDLELNSVQSQSIESQYLPTLPSSPTSLSKKADLALVISPPRHSDSTINQWRKQNTGVGLSHMSGAYTRETLLACPLEVKRQGGDYNEAVCQLAVWSAAALEKLRILASMGRDKEMLEGFPYPGWTVVGHEWQLHISWKEDSGKVGSESFVGDLSSGALTTPFTIFRSRVELSFTSPGVGSRNLS
ncbi:hypothetical protein B0J14DRAFT_663144 [Halenospora varia]|nr:hypothetical protein B0J14DRAFT_663144 [Halenospora varia]